MTARDIVLGILTITDGVILLYFLVYMGLNIGMLGQAFSEVRRLLRRRSFEPAPQPGPFAPLVTLLVPAFNEEVTVVQSVRSLLRLQYPRFEIVLVNDGSSDRTVEVLERAFGFLPAPVELHPWLPTAHVRRVLQAPTPKGSGCQRFLLLDKENGGKADALNAGIDAASGAWVCSMDADSLIVPDALDRVVQELLDDPTDVVAVGVQVGVSNGSKVQDGRIVDPRLPDSVIARVQVVEYMRSFTQNRAALGGMDMLLILSGVFAIFRKDLLVEAGGFLTKRATSRAIQEYTGLGAHTVCEDMEVVVRLHRWLRDRGRTGRLVLVPEPLAWTEVPEDMRSLGKQRARWQRGLCETLLLHGRMLFRPRFGRVGLISLPYQLIFEAITPVVEGLGVVLLPLTWWLGLLSTRTAVLFLLTALLGNVVLSIGSVALATWAEPAARPLRPASRLFNERGVGDMLRMALAAVHENIGYRQILLYWRLRGTWDFLRGKQMWDKFARKGFEPVGGSP
jgi:cellulose synthase/poly-beta-1,6-N-acetylglucosamine synthase-like glycosyltransferase